jgi:hypothetical protein
MDSGHLFYEGGISNQTDFFVYASYFVKRRLKQWEVEQQKKAMSKHKKK